MSKILDLSEANRCIYCNEEKPQAEFSEEHVLPQAVGGNLTPTNPFKTPDVCARCNNLCGGFVDVGFIKSWFTTAGRTEEGLRHVKFDNETIFPLRYMGPIPALQHNGKICEMWIGPTGDSIYHFHDPYPEISDMPVLVGPAPAIRSGIDKGYVFVFLVPSNPVWWVPILRSVKSHFKGSTLYLGNGSKPPGTAFSEIPEALIAQHQHLKSQHGTGHVVELQISAYAETRFLAKLALGIGHILLSAEFSTSADADILRNMIWARTSDERASIPMRGTGFFGGDNHGQKETLTWQRGHVLTLWPVGDHLALIASFYGSQVATVVISSTPAHWSEKIQEPVTYIISPSLRRCVGPISTPDFLAHRIGEIKHQALEEMERELSTIPPLPPVHLPEHSTSQDVEV